MNIEGRLNIWCSFEVVLVVEAVEPVVKMILVFMFKLSYVKDHNVKIVRFMYTIGIEGNNIFCLQNCTVTPVL